MEPTDEQIREIPFVMLDEGQRMPMTKEAMKHFGLTQGQTITDQIFRAILRFKIADCLEQTVEDWMAREGKKTD